MKRKLACLAALLALLLGLASCGGLQSLSGIGASDYINNRGSWRPDNSFSCKLRVWRAVPGGHHTDFTYNATLEQLRGKLQARCPDAVFSIAQDKFIVIEQRDTIFLIEQVERMEGDRYNRFQIFAPIANLDIDTIFNNGKLIYIPYHLIEGLETQYYQGERLLPTEFSFSVLGTMDDFEAFYRKWSAVDVIRPDGSTLVVTCDTDGACPQLTLSFEGDTVNFSAE